MPTSPSYPGVYVEEVSSGVHTITGVATAIAAFVDFFQRGPVAEGVQVLSYSDFEREFGGLDTRSEASYAIQQFFLNGGAQAWVVRAVSADATHLFTAAAHTIGTALTVTAVSGGAWGNSLRVKVDQNGTASGEFNLTLSEVATVNNRTVVARQETFRNLSMDSAKSNFADAVVNDANTGSKLARVKASGATAPAVNGTTSGTPTIAGLPVSSQVSITIGATTKVMTAALAGTTLSSVAAKLQTAIRSAAPADPQFAGATVAVVSGHLWVQAGAGDPAATVTFAVVGADTTASDLGLTATATSVAQEYVLTAGADGLPPGATDLVNALAALNTVAFNLLSLPRTSLVGAAVPSTSTAMSATEALTVLSVAIATCEARRALFLLDTPYGLGDYQAIQSWMASHDSLRSAHAALYYPRLRVPDPLNDYRVRSIGASGAVAGLYSRTDTGRGVWKAPAGTEATLKNVAELDDVLTDAENGVLNPLAINCIRSFPTYGKVVWGARTLAGADQASSDYKYVPVRRLANYIEESLWHGTKWVVFEPNDEPLWAQVRLNLGAFMHNLFRQGAFQGKTPKEAYFIKCDSETTTQTHINQGVVNIVVGFAPVKPAEFVILKFQQIAGQIEV